MMNEYIHGFNVNICDSYIYLYIINLERKINEKCTCVRAYLNEMMNTYDECKDIFDFNYTNCYNCALFLLTIITYISYILSCLYLH